MAMCEWLLSSSGMDFFSLVVVEVNSVLVLGLMFSSCAVQDSL